MSEYAAPYVWICCALPVTNTPTLWFPFVCRDQLSHSFKRRGEIFCSGQVLWCFFRLVYKIAISFLMSLSPSVSVRMQQFDSHWTDFDETWYLSFFFRKYVEKIKFHWNPVRITGTLREDIFTFVTFFRRSLLRMRNFLNKSCRENQNTHFVFYNFV